MVLLSEKKQSPRAVGAVAAGAAEEDYNYYSLIVDDELRGRELIKDGYGGYNNYY